MFVVSFSKILKMTKRPGSLITEKNSGPAKQTNMGHWSGGLLKSMEDPELIVISDNLVTVIKDAYPKAEFHYLVLPKQSISSHKAIKVEHLDLLKHMDKVARDVIADDKHNNKKFKWGYHAEPSMSRLHLHVISDDMNSPCLKTKKHWNSFTTDFFLKSQDVLEALERNGKVTIFPREKCKKFMELPLKCHKCEYLPKNMPDLKKHILGHL